MLCRFLCITYPCFSHFEFINLHALCAGIMWGAGEIGWLGPGAGAADVSEMTSRDPHPSVVTGYTAHHDIAHSSTPQL